MNVGPWLSVREPHLTRERVCGLLDQVVEKVTQTFGPLSRVLIAPPDRTRAHCGAGWMAAHLYRRLEEQALVRVLPALGTHAPHSADQNQAMFAGIPGEAFLVHNAWTGCRLLGTLPAAQTADLSQGSADWPVPLWLNRDLLASWDVVIHIGLVVPHEVVGFSSHNKNLWSGLAGVRTIAATHMLAAAWGIERTMGHIQTPVRHCFNAADRFLPPDLPQLYLLLVMEGDRAGGSRLSGCYVGTEEHCFNAAAAHSLAENITRLDHPPHRIVCYMDPAEYGSAWLANKAIYRCRTAVAQGGEIVVIAPAVDCLAEDRESDRFLRLHGYAGREQLLDVYKNMQDRDEKAHLLAHLIHGSPEGRFRVRYAAGDLDPELVRHIGYAPLSLARALQVYRPSERPEGWHRDEDGGEYYFIPNPAGGLWSSSAENSNSSG